MVMNFLYMVLFSIVCLNNSQNTIHRNQDKYFVKSNHFVKDTTFIYIRYDTFSYLDTNGLAKTKCMTEIMKIVKTEIPFDTLKTQYPDCITDKNIIKAYQMMIEQEQRQRSPDHIRIKKWEVEGACR
jgi:hypothetical protein